MRLFILLLIKTTNITMKETDCQFNTYIICTMVEGPTHARGCCIRDNIIVGFTTTYAISAYHHCCCEFESQSERGVQHYMIKFVSGL